METYKVGKETYSKTMIIFGLILILVYALCQLHTVEANETKNIVCYHGSWSANRKSLGNFDLATDFDPFLCTHIIYAFINIDETGDLRVRDPTLDLEDNNGRGNIRKFNNLKLINPKLKTLVSVGGWNAGSQNFSIVAADPLKRAKFLESSIEFLQRHDFNGLDIDWEYPNQRHNLTNNDRENFLELLKECKEGFKPHGFMLTAAVVSTPYSVELSYNITEMVKYLDIINVMSYNLHGPWNKVVGINAPLYAGPLDITDRAKQLNFDAIAKYWISKGAPRDKLVMGVHFYGRSYTLKDPNNHDVGAEKIGPGIGGQYTSQAGILVYYELCEKFQKEASSWHLEWESTQMVPYAYNGDQWIGYENETSISLKADYVKKENLGGIMVWTLELDDYRGLCSSKRYPLLKVINETLFDKVATDQILLGAVAFNCGQTYLYNCIIVLIFSTVMIHLLG